LHRIPIRAGHDLVDLGAADPDDRLEQRLRHPAGAPLEHEQRRGQRVHQVVDERLDEVVSLTLLGDPTDHDSVLGQERRRLGGIDEREQRVPLVARRTDVDLLHHQRVVLVTY